MWSELKQRQFDDLRRQAELRSLTADEEQLLDRLLHEVAEREWAAIRPALARLGQEQQRLQTELSRLGTQNAVLAALAERYANLVTRARTQLTDLAQERDELRTEYERVLQT